MVAAFFVSLAVTLITQHTRCSYHFLSVYWATFWGYMNHDWGAAILRYTYIMWVGLKNWVTSKTSLCHNIMTMHSLSAVLTQLDGTGNRFAGQRERLETLLSIVVPRRSAAASPWSWVHYVQWNYLVFRCFFCAVMTCWIRRCGEVRIASARLPPPVSATTRSAAILTTCANWTGELSHRKSGIGGLFSWTLIVYSHWSWCPCCCSPSPVVEASVPATDVWWQVTVKLAELLLFAGAGRGSRNTASDPDSGHSASGHGSSCSHCVSHWKARTATRPSPPPPITSQAVLKPPASVRDNKRNRLGEYRCFRDRRVLTGLQGGKFPSGWDLRWQVSRAKMTWPTWCTKQRSEEPVAVARWWPEEPRHDSQPQPVILQHKDVY